MTNYSFLAEKCEKDIDIILKSGIMDEMAGKSFMELEQYEGDYVDIECNDGRSYHHWYVYAFFDKYDNPETDEESIDILREENESSGVTLFRSEIRSIAMSR